jgi:hypothetical protein
LQDCDWNPNRYKAITHEEKAAALAKLLASPKWKRPLDVQDKRFLSAQIVERPLGARAVPQPPRHVEPAYTTQDFSRGSGTPTSIFPWTSGPKNRGGFSIETAAPDDRDGFWIQTAPNDRDGFWIPVEPTTPPGEQGGGTINGQRFYIVPLASPR